LLQHVRRAVNGGGLKASKAHPFRFLCAFCGEIAQNKETKFVRFAVYSNLLQIILDFWHEIQI